MINEALLLLSEVFLSAYPSLIKLVDASVLLQTGLRMGIFTALAGIAGIVIGNPIALSTLFRSETILTGLLNLVHVSSSYKAFEQLDGGSAMALFYTYPVWNILGTAWLFGESISMASMPWIGLALLGAILLAQPTPQNWTMLGVVMALLAAFSETGIYLWFKTHKEGTTEPWTKMVQMYGSSGVLWCIGIGLALFLGYLTKGALSISGMGFTAVLLFNAFIGFFGTSLRFYLIPNVSTVLFSALSFFGVIAAYGMGWIFSGEVPSVLQALGALAIVGANVMVVRGGGASAPTPPSA